MMQPHPPLAIPRLTTFARPQSHRFVQETLSRLSEDSIRAGSPVLRRSDLMNSRSPSPAPAYAGTEDCSKQGSMRTATPGSWEPRRPGTVTPAASSLWGGEAANRIDSARLEVPELSRAPTDWRAAMREEIDSALSTGAVSQFLEGWSSQFIEWRNIDENLARQLHTRLSHLEDTSQSLITFLQEYVTTEEFTSFRDSMNTYSRLVDELAAVDGGQSNLLTSFEKAIEKSVSTSITQLIQELREDEGKRRSQEGLQQEALTKELHARHDGLQKHLSSVAEAVQCQDIFLRSELEPLMREVGNRVENQLRFSADQFDKNAFRATQEAAVTMQKSLAAEHEALRAEIRRLVAGDKWPVEPQDSLRDMLQNFDNHLVQGVANSRQAELWQLAAERDRESRQAMEKELELSQANTERLSEQLRQLDTDLKEQTNSLEQTTLRLHAVPTWAKYCGYIDQVLSRGRLKINIHGEWLELLGLDFTAVSAKAQPIARWQDEEIAAAVLADAAELLLGCLAGVPATIESHMKAAKGKAEFWDEVSLNRALLVRDSLEQRGVPYKMIQTVAGFHGKTGLGRTCIRLCLRLFPDKEDPEEPKGKGNQKSPRGRSASPGKK
eukprot:TRINITY_DN22911_c0_g1_i3.p1 TRINITY_DN22911_c0_g1~~TRINITY_DN22911_c0_g1_i3.p1  ORF type:complete len:626 (+),score=126.64 TRINITY_DN22911_c0_g1_i3:54-1880(+)